MCSFNASPLPTPRANLPSSSTALVAAACATMAGLSRVVGQVTAVVTGSLQTWEMAPIIDQTKGLCPWVLFHGWKWSLIHRASNPHSCAIAACSMSAAGPYSSVDRKYPKLVTAAPFPRSSWWSGSMPAFIHFPYGRKSCAARARAGDPVVPSCRCSYGILIRSTLGQGMTAGPVPGAWLLGDGGGQATWCISGRGASVDNSDKPSPVLIWLRECAARELIDRAAAAARGLGLGRRRTPIGRLAPCEDRIRVIKDTGLPPRRRCPAGISSGSASTKPANRSAASWKCSPHWPTSHRDRPRATAGPHQTTLAPGRTPHRGSSRACSCHDPLSAPSTSVDRG